MKISGNISILLKDGSHKNIYFFGPKSYKKSFKIASSYLFEGKAKLFTVSQIQEL